MRIDVFHDTACPWCRIGKAHLKQAIAQWTGDPVTVQYHAFFLNPDIPPEGYPFREYMTAKGGGQVPMEGWFDAPRQMGQQAGLTFNFEAIDRAPNTTRSHQLIMLAPPDLQEQVIDAVYAAYFEQGQDIGDLDVLVSIAAACGLDAETVRAELAADSQQAAVMASARQGAQIGVRGVPFFIVNQRLAFSGAQPADVILDVMRQAQAQTQTQGVKE
jgi:predicted DsbA family dithiol-disulfide isomerase